MPMHALAILLAGLSIAGRAAVKEELKKLEGTWVVELIVRDPRERGPDEGKGIRCIIKGAKVAAQLPGQDRPLPGGLLLHIDPLMKPKAMDLRSERGKDITLAIYELKCDTLRVCCSPLGKPRPTEFASQPGSGHSLIVLKRAKP